MGRPKGSKNKKESDNKGKERMERFEDRNKSELSSKTDIPVLSPVEEYNSTITCFQKRGDNEWEKVEIPFKRKKTLEINPTSSS